MDLVGVVSEPLARDAPALGGAEARRSCRSASTCTASSRSRAPRRVRHSGSTRTGRAFCSRPTQHDPRSASTVRSSSRATRRLLTLGDVDPDQVPLYVNAANAVLVPSEREGFGLAVLEALACDVPVLSTPVGIAPEALEGQSTAPSAPRSTATSGAKRCAAPGRPRSANRRPDKQPSATRPTRWQPGSWTPGERCYDARIGQRRRPAARAPRSTRA